MNTFLVYSRVELNGAKWLTEDRVHATSAAAAMAQIAKRAGHTPTHTIRVPA